MIPSIQSPASVRQRIMDQLKDALSELTEFETVSNERELRVIKLPMAWVWDVSESDDQSAMNYTFKALTVQVGAIYEFLPPPDLRNRDRLGRGYLALIEQKLLEDVRRNELAWDTQAVSGTDMIQDFADQQGGEGLAIAIRQFEVHYLQLFGEPFRSLTEVPQ